jgi:hypothetical protein
MSVDEVPSDVLAVTRNFGARGLSSMPGFYSRRRGGWKCEHPADMLNSDATPLASVCWPGPRRLQGLRHFGGSSGSTLASWRAFAFWYLGQPFFQAIGE